MKNATSPNKTTSSRDDRDLLTEKQAKEELPFSESWFQKQRWRGLGPPFLRLSNRVFYRRSSLREWVDAHMRRAEEQERTETR